MTNRIIIASNRLPFRITEKGGKAVLTQSSGGLVSSMTSYFQKIRSAPGGSLRQKAQWVGTSDMSEAKFKQLVEGRSVNENFDLSPVYLPEITQDKFYNGFCNDTIWPLFHYFPSYAKFNSNDYEHYVLANRLFCDKIVQVYQPGDAIWIHDYHLMLLPEMIRKALPDASIGYFLHIPFPSFELFRIIPNPWKTDILNGLLGADLIGFHTNDYMQHFLKSVQQTLAFDISLRKIILDERTVITDTFPVSIDFTKFYTASNQTAVYEEKNSIKKTINGRQLIISVDRLDYAKAIINRLESYELFFEKYPMYRGKVTYILVVVPSRDIITKYRENKREIERLISSINGKYGSIGWTPVVYQYKSIDFTRLTALYFAADAALITPLRDGMNLVAKEFVSTRLDKRGVLILSETAGAASELAEALLVNPTDRKQISESIYKALTMPVEEQMARNEIMQNRIKNYDVVKWVEDFMSQLQLHKTAQEKLKVKEVTPFIEREIYLRYEQANKRLLLLDYDGTLSPLERLPRLAKPSQEVLNLLLSLTKDKRNRIMLVSGRPRAVLDEWFPGLTIGMVAEHGGFYKLPGAEWKQTNHSELEWKHTVMNLFQFYQSRCYGSFIEEKELALAWHYRNTEKEMGIIRSRELLNALRDLSSDMDFQVLEGNMVIEVRPNGVNKGAAAKLLLELQPSDFVLAIGDDRTDEDLFRALPENMISFRVGLTQSHATYNFKQQKEVTTFLKMLVGSEIKSVQAL
jgi:trehalose 6-phosphate synthase/phosphatase